MRELILPFLAEAYRKSVTGQGNPGHLFKRDDPAFMAAARAERDRIIAIGLPQAELAKRDFASYQALRALTEELGKQ